jgi:hypothetical protein
MTNLIDPTIRPPQNDTLYWIEVAVKCVCWITICAVALSWVFK